MPDSSEEKINTQTGVIHVSEDVIVELVRKTVQGIENALGRKYSGIRADVDHSRGIISIDVYILVRYGQRIPDIAWDVQEKVKDNLERYTGYEVRAVNVSVQGIYTGGNGADLQIDLSDEEFSSGYGTEAD